MNRKQATQNVGKRCSVWTQQNGLYRGVLVEVTDDRPWRANVQVEEVVEWPAVFLEGEVINVGASSVKILDADEPRVSWRTSALRAAEKQLAFLKRFIRENAVAQRRGNGRHTYGWGIEARELPHVYRWVRALRAHDPSELVPVPACGRCGAVEKSPCIGFTTKLPMERTCAGRVRRVRPWPASGMMPRGMIEFLGAPPAAAKLNQMVE